MFQKAFKIALQTKNLHFSRVMGEGDVFLIGITFFTNCSKTLPFKISVLFIIGKQFQMLGSRFHQNYPAKENVFFFSGFFGHSIIGQMFPLLY